MNSLSRIAKSIYFSGALSTKHPMATWLEVVLEIVKITVPALVVFITVYYLFRQYLEGQQRLKAMELRQAQQGTTLPMRLQAYERLSLYCDRMLMPNLLLRVKRPGMTASELRVALLLAIQQEFEHNITQQVYVSDQLWQIIRLARDDSMDVISTAAEEVEPRAEADVLARAILDRLNQRGSLGLETALQAIKKEAAIYLG